MGSVNWQYRSRRRANPGGADPPINHGEFGHLHGSWVSWADAETASHEGSWVERRAESSKMEPPGGSRHGRARLLAAPVNDGEAAWSW
jgi:hypothetical protein